MTLVRITFIARLFGELVTTVSPERVPEVIKKLWSKDNVIIDKIQILNEEKK